MRNFRQLKVWNKAHELRLAVYQNTAVFPADERYGLTNQMRRAAASIGANIAEGSAKESDSDFCRYLQIALGSVSELEDHLVLARDLGLLKTVEQQRLLSEAIELKKMLTRFIQYLRRPEGMQTASSSL